MTLIPIESNFQFIYDAKETAKRDLIEFFSLLMNIEDYRK